MDRRTGAWKAFLYAGAVALSAAMLWFGTGLHPLWWLTWIALLPVLLVAGRVSGAAAFGITAVAWAIGALNMWHYYRVVEAPLAIAITVVVGPACVAGLAVLAWRAFVRRGALGRGALALPAVWVAYEFVQSKTWPHGTWGSLAYTQVDFLPLLQIAAIAGVAGISFLLFLFPAAIAAMAVGNASRTQLRVLRVLVGCLFAAVLVWGSVRLHTGGAAQHVTVGLMSHDQPHNALPDTPDQKRTLFAEYAAQARALLARGAQVVVAPEKIAFVPDRSIGVVDTPMEAAANGSGDVVVGIARVTSTAKLNEARLYSRDGMLAATYEKHHMLPAFEGDMLPGTTRLVFDRPSGKWGIEICKDMDFPRLARQYGNDGVGLLLVPAWDFGIDGWLHDRMAVVRGVESGFTIARAARWGLMTVSDDRGRVLAERTTSPAGMVALLASAPVRHDATFYARFGDWFGWLDLALLAALLADLVLGSRRPKENAA